jgi:hypothetical protein
MPDKENLISHRRQSRKSGIDAYTKNPFWEPTEVTLGKKHIKVGGDWVTNSNTGETTHTAVVHKVVEVDDDKFVKLYTQNLKAFFDIKPSTQKVLQSVLSSLQESPNQDSIYLPWFVCEDYSKENDLKISRTSFHNSMRELIEKKFLAESEEPNRYWINPHLVFNGTRMAFINEYRRSSPKPQKSSKANGDAHLQVDIESLINQKKRPLTAAEKLDLASKGQIVEMSHEEAESVGGFVEDALSPEDALESSAHLREAK